MIYYNNKSVKKLYNGTDLVTKMNKTVGGSRLPSGYTEVEYVENTSSAYTETDFYPTQNTRVVAEFQASEILNNPRMFGAGAWNGLGFIGNIESLNNSGLYYFKYGNTNTWYQTNVSADTNKHKFDLNKNEYYIDDVLAGTAATTSFTMTYHLGIFNAPNKTSGSGAFTLAECFKGKCYSLKVYESDVLVRDFVPCINPSNVVGFYDIVNDTFYGSKSNYTYTAGNPVTTTTDKAIFQYVTEGEEPTPVDYSKEYLTFVAEANNVSFSLAGGVNGNTFQYSTDDGQNWNNVSIGQTTSSINTGDKIMFKASSLSIGTETGIGTIRPSGNASVEGNVMSLIYGDNFSGQTTISNNFQLRKLFSGATHITSAENMVIPISTFKKQCCSQMFSDCSNLVTPPKVVGTATARFDGDYCISDMFANCSSLATAPELPMTTLGKQCYWYMMQGCTSLTEAPLLSAATINTQSYCGMFYGCTNLNSVTCLATGGITTSNCNNWLNNVAANGTFVKKAGSSWTTGTNGIPSNWTVIEE